MKYFIEQVACCKRVIEVEAETDEEARDKALEEDYTSASEWVLVEEIDLASDIIGKEG